MRNYYIDIETIALPKEEREFSRPTEDSIKYGNTKDPEKRKAKYDEAVAEWEAGDGCGLCALTGQVALVGIALNDDDVAVLHGPEEDILKSVWDIIQVEADTNIIGFFSKTFDIPFLMRRSMVRGVWVPDVLKQDIAQYRPDMFIDLMDVWRLGDKTQYVKLEILCSALGIPVKSGEISGANFAEWWEKDKDACVEYCKEDVMATRALAKRLEVVA